MGSALPSRATTRATLTKVAEFILLTLVLASIASYLLRGLPVLGHSLVAVGFAFTLLVAVIQLQLTSPPVSTYMAETGLNKTHNRDYARRLVATSSQIQSGSRRYQARMRTVKVIQ